MTSGTYNGRLIHEADQIISYIERGSPVLKFYPRRRPERKTLAVRRETHQVVWSRNEQPRISFDGSIEIREIKEVRIGKFSKDFERWTEETKRLDNTKCFTIYYGSEFKLRSASFVVPTDKDTDAWIKGLGLLIEESKKTSYPLQIARWLRREFYTLENGQEK